MSPRYPDKVRHVKLNGCVVEPDAIPTRVHFDYWYLLLIDDRRMKDSAVE